MTVTTPSYHLNLGQNNNQSLLLVTSPTAILDEVHIMSPTNHDANPHSSFNSFTWSSLKAIFQNDYWGRHMNSHSSHKSYRPFTVVTFRITNILYKKLANVTSYLYVQRVVNVILHSALFHILSRLIHSLHLVPHTHKHEHAHIQMSPVEADQHRTMVDAEVVLSKLITILSQTFFILHPSHTEVVCNIANRAHLLSILLVLVCLDLNPQNHWMILGSIYTCALLSCETCIFLLPGVIICWIYIWIVNYNIDDDDDDDSGGEENDNNEDEQVIFGNDEIKKKEEDVIIENDNIINNNNNKRITNNDHITTNTILKAIQHLLPRILLITSISFTYLYIRHINDWLSIPNGLIRRAENPFYTFGHHHSDTSSDTSATSSTFHRFINYAFVLSIHLVKSFGLGIIDIIGLSHEYGYNCIPEIKLCEWYYDGRFWLPIPFLIVVLLFLWNRFGISFQQQQQQQQQALPAPQQHHQYQQRKGYLLWVVFCTWIFSSLFPICGFLKVGTFVADRIVVPSTVATSIFWGYVFGHWVLEPLVVTKTSSSTSTLSSETTSKQYTWKSQTSIENKSHFIFRSITLILITSFLSIKTYNRTIEWMDPKSLFESSLRTCPNSAKSNLEISKLYSGGLSPNEEDIDLDKALLYLETAEEIDDEFCDLHYQFALVFFRQGKYVEFEERIVNGVLCPFTMDGSYRLFQQYWRAVLEESGGSSHSGGTRSVGVNDDGHRNSDAQIRYKKYVKIIQDAIQEEERKGKHKKEKIKGEEQKRRIDAEL